MLFYYSVIRFLAGCEWCFSDLEEKKNKKSAVHFPGHSLCLFLAMAIYIQVFVSAPFIVSICFFGNKALGECWTLGNYTLYI